MVNYYTELRIDKNLSIDDIKKELNSLENIWRRRLLNNPDKATKIIALILEAREIFKTEESKRQYDRKLAGTDKRKGKENREENVLQLEKIKSDAVKFFKLEQYDIALKMINSALSLMSTLGMEDDLILSLAASIYKNSGDNRSALDFINRAILINSDGCTNYVIKAEIVNNLGHIDQKRLNLKIAISKADENGTLQDKAEVLGIYARSLYFDSPQDRENAVRYAREALKLGETWGNAQAVIDAADKADQILRKQQEAERLAREKAAEDARFAKQQDEQNKKKQRQHNAKIARRRILYIISWPIWLICQAINGPIFFSSLAGAIPRFMTTPLFLTLAVIGTTVPSYAEAAHIGYRGILGGCCIFSVIMYSVYTQYVKGVGFFALLILLAVLQFISWAIGTQQDKL